MSGYLPTLPRNIEDRELTISLPPPVVEVFSVDDLREIFSASSRRSQLYWLLLLNTGMQQTDLAKLSHSQIDLGKGVLVRRRGKTSRFDRVPVVQYPLWSATKRLLAEHVSAGDPAIKNVQGEPLVKERIDGGRYKKSDAIKNAFFRVSKKTGLRKPLKTFRKTVASRISETSDKETSQLYLGHAPTTIAEKHYLQESFQKLEKSLLDAEQHFLKDLDFT